jgi:hypothetical protein
LCSYSTSQFLPVRSTSCILGSLKEWIWGSLTSRASRIASFPHSASFTLAVLSKASHAFRWHSGKHFLIYFVFYYLLGKVKLAHESYIGF